MSQTQPSELLRREPCDGVMFVRRDIGRSSRPRIHQPDLHVKRIGTDFMHRRAHRGRDVDAQLFPEFSNQRRTRKLPRLHVTTRQIPDVRIVGPVGAAMTQQHPVAVPEERRDYVSRGLALRGDRHTGILPAGPPGPPLAAGSE